MNAKQIIGSWGEQYAANIYARRGFTIVARHLFNTKGRQFGEIDFVAVRGDVIIFVEVKTRTSITYGLPQESMTPAKQVRLLRIVQWFLTKNPRYYNFQPRIDVCAITLSLPFGFIPVHLDKFVKSATIIPNAVELH